MPKANPDGTKLCPKCKQTLLVYRFGKSRHSSDGLATYCKSCMRLLNIASIYKLQQKGVKVKEEKKCPKCQTVKKAEEFYKMKASRDGLHTWCKDCTKAVRRKYWRDNKPKLSAKESTQRRAILIEMIRQYGGKCACCGESQFEFLTIDHKLNDGAEHRRQAGSTREVMNQIRRAGYPTDRYQILCYNCNCAKGRFGYCPHQKKSDP